MPRYSSLMRKFTREEITQFLQASKVVFKQTGLVIRAAPAQKEWGRVVIIVPRRFGNSPQRHTFKRQVRAIFYTNKFFEQPYDLAIFAYHQIQGISYGSLEAIITTVYSQIAQLLAHTPDSGN